MSTSVPTPVAQAAGALKRWTRDADAQGNDNGTLSTGEVRHAAGMPEPIRAVLNRIGSDAGNSRGGREVSNFDRWIDRYAERYAHAFQEAGGPLSKEQLEALEGWGSGNRFSKFQTAMLAIVGGAKSPTLSNRELRTRAARYIVDNGGGRGLDIYPDGNHGEIGSQASLISGEAAGRLAAFTAVFMGRRAPEAIQSFDAATQSLAAIRITEDEERLSVSVVDNATGKVTFIDDLGMVDTTYMIEQADFERLVGSVASFGVEEYDEIDHFEIIDRLVAAGIPLDIGGDEVHFDPYTEKAALTFLRERFAGADVDARVAEAREAFAEAARAGEVVSELRIDSIDTSFWTGGPALELSGALLIDGERKYFNALFPIDGDRLGEMRVELY